MTIKQAIERLNFMIQQQIADRTGLSRYTVNKAFFGRRIRSTTADKIERVLLDV